MDLLAAPARIGIPWIRLLVALACALLATAAAASPALPQSPADSSSVARLAPSSDPPWNPPGPVPHERRWEQVVRLPGEVVSLPLRAAGWGAKQFLLFADDHDLFPRIAAHLSVLDRYGVIAGPASLGDRTGIGGEIGLRPPFFPNLVGSLSGSTTGYNRGRVALEYYAATLEYESDWRPREGFFGVGPDAREQDGANYAAKSQFARLELRYPYRPSSRPVRELLEDPAVSTDDRRPRRHTLRVWAGPRDLVEKDGREHTGDRQPLSVRFPALAASRLGRIEHFVYGAEAEVDTRSGRPHWWKGWRASAEVERYDQPVDVLSFDRATKPSTPFTRWTWEGEVGWSFWRDPRTFRLYGRAVDQIGLTNTGVFPLSELSRLGGDRGLYGFEPGRFHDADLVLGRLTYVFPLARYFEGDLHVEAGNVAARLLGTRIDDLRTSYGAAMRIRDPHAPLGSVGVDWSEETVRVRFTIGGVE